MSANRLLAAAPILILAACNAQPMAPDRDPRGEARLAQLLAGKVAGAPVDCLEPFRMNDMEVIDRDTIAYRDGRTVYIQNTDGDCYPSGRSAGYTLVTTRFGTNRACRGDISKVVDSSSGSFAGSCAFNDFIPYRAP